jgi:MFS family permease
MPRDPLCIPTPNEPAVGSLAYGVFVVSMTFGRWSGTRFLDRFGRAPVLRACAASALIGLLIVVFGPNLISATVGTVLWGLGTALGFPVGMSAAADRRHYAAGRVSVVATIGYVAFPAGPPLVGLIGNEVGVLHPISITAGLVAIGLLVAGATRPDRRRLIAGARAGCAGSSRMASCR